MICFHYFFYHSPRFIVRFFFDFSFFQYFGFLCFIDLDVHPSMFLRMDDGFDDG